MAPSTSRCDGGSCYLQTFGGAAWWPWVPSVTPRWMIYYTYRRFKGPPDPLRMSCWSNGNRPVGSWHPSRHIREGVPTQRRMAIHPGGLVPGRLEQQEDVLLTVKILSPRYSLPSPFMHWLFTSLTIYRSIYSIYCIDCLSTYLFISLNIKTLKTILFHWISKLSEKRFSLKNQAMIMWQIWISRPSPSPKRPLALAWSDQSILSLSPFPLCSHTAMSVVTGQCYQRWDEGEKKKATVLQAKWHVRVIR